MSCICICFWCRWNISRLVISAGIIFGISLGLMLLGASGDGVAAATVAIVAASVIGIEGPKSSQMIILAFLRRIGEYRICLGNLRKFGIIVISILLSSLPSSSIGMIFQSQRSIARLDLQ